MLWKYSNKRVAVWLISILGLIFVAGFSIVFLFLIDYQDVKKLALLSAYSFIATLFSGLYGIYIGNIIFKGGEGVGSEILVVSKQITRNKIIAVRFIFWSLFLVFSSLIYFLIFSIIVAAFNYDSLIVGGEYALIFFIPFLSFLTFGTEIVDKSRLCN